MTDIDVRVQEVSKDYRLGVRGRATFSALKNVTLDVGRAESFGVIGRNGAGKSTLLKLLAGITAPTRGRITIVGRLAALIEVGSGFHPELTGRENAYLSGSILGMRRRELAERLDSIVEFAGVERFLDTPVKWYSSGMYVRLGFAIAAHLEPDILLIDEVLAVGDAEFQVKCLERIRGLKQQGVTILFISHDLSAVERLCDRVALLDKGVVVSQGLPADVIAEYHHRISTDESEPSGVARAPIARALALTNLSWVDPDRPGAIVCRSGGPLTMTARFTASEHVDNVYFEVAFFSTDWKTRFASLQTARTRGALAVGPPGGVVEFSCPSLSLQPGAYFIGASARDAATSAPINWFEGNSTLYVTSEEAVMPGHVHVPFTWRFEPFAQRQTV